MRPRPLAIILLLATPIACSAPSADNQSDAATTTALADERPPVAERSAEERDVLLAVQRFFDTMTAKDSAGTHAVLDPEGDFVSVRWNDAGERIVRRSSNAEYLQGVASEPRLFTERMWNAEVKIHGPIATVWTPYDFHVDGEFSHCGVDAFQLVLRDAGWVITGGIYTVEPDGCAVSPLGEL